MRVLFDPPQLCPHLPPISYSQLPLLTPIYPFDPLPGGYYLLLAAAPRGTCSKPFKGFSEKKDCLFFRAWWPCSHCPHRRFPSAKRPAGATRPSANGGPDAVSFGQPTPAYISLSQPILTPLFFPVLTRMNTNSPLVKISEIRLKAFSVFAPLRLCVRH